MFSSLEALDAEDTLNAAPVVRQGAFQPKAKPRARKGGLAPVRKPSSLPSAPASVTVGEAGPIHDAASTDHVEGFRRPIIAASECQERNLPVQVSEVSESSIKVGAEAQVTIAPLQDNPSTDVNGSSRALSDGDYMGSVTTVLHDAPLAFEELLASPSFKPEQSIRKQHEPRRQSHLWMDDEGAPLELAMEESLSHESLCLIDVLEPFTTGIESHESEVAAPLKYIEHSQTERLDQSPLEGNKEPLVEHNADARGIETFVGTNTEPVMDKKRRGHHKTKTHKSPMEGYKEPSVEHNADARGIETFVGTNTEPVTDKRRRGHHKAKTHKENASLDVDSNLPKETSKPITESVSASSFHAKEIAHEAYGAQGIAQECAVGNVVDPVKKKEKSGNNQSKQVSKDMEKICSNGVNADAPKETKKAKRAAIFAAAASPSTCQPGADVGNEGNCDLKSAQDAMVGDEVETLQRKKRTGNEAEEQRDITENVSSYTDFTSCSRETNKRMRKRPARFDNGADDDLIRAITQESFERSENRKRGNSIEVYKGEDDTDNDLLITFVQEKAKLKKSEVGLCGPSLSQPATVFEDSIDKFAPPANETGQKKKFRKCLPSRRRVERSLMNPANPDLDPKKMTMKDIIRLAEAKEKMLKNGNPKKAKNGSEPTTNAFEKEDESFTSVCLAPQVQIVDGRIVINQESLTVNAHPKDDIRTYKRVEETHSKLNYHSYMKRTPKLKWRKDETDLFYEALREFGTNFAMIQHLFPGRTRKQVLLKYKKEEKSCPLRISEAMRLKPCETSHFMEVMSSMNLLPNEIPDALESETGVDPFGTTSCREEVENNGCILAGAERQAADDTSKLEEFSMQINCREKHENIGSNPWNTEAVTLLKPDDTHIEEAPKTDETTKPSESQHKVLSPPRKKKSLFSYQNSIIKS